MSAWSKLQKSLYNIVSDRVDFQLHQSVYRMTSSRGNVNIPRYWITVDKNIVFDYPKQFMDRVELASYPYETQISDISECIRAYIDCPVDLLLEKNFEEDQWGITDIFKAVDKRLGKEKLKAHFENGNSTIWEILNKRFNNSIKKQENKI